ncbi:tetratricopeptide repeat-containing sulfotransferase family protein [Rhodanobacter sp. C03]|uniref:tetratricopeptide repeat-containing sulfotransferase family protein n=1 Tax=Rhodanobacter sp. C03 TaxID=1945858 RepID=UPI000984D24C|nr:tetratricopeptide repeat-containing sulfotransferase family protein [Rhodanobacter sp. C03]OOG59451.1 sulfotransferase [Rhodanobacter sp. C03]
MADPAQLYAQLVATFNRGNWPEAQALATQLLPFAPNHAGVYSIAGVVSLELQQLAQAVTYLRRAAELDPTRADFATLYAKALSAAGLPGEAVLAADLALALSPDDPMTLDTLGVIYTQARAHERAVAAFRAAVARSPTQASCRFNLATALVAIGDLDAAELEFEACIKLAPKYWNPHLSLAQLGRQTPARNHVERLQSLLLQYPGDVAAMTYLNMALAKEYEDLASYPKAFECLVRGKSAARGGRRYSIQRDQVMFEKLTRAFPEPQPESLGDPTEEPIFVVGMPRSGTTLVERILSSHPDVYAAGELQNFATALQRVSGSQTPVLFDPEIITRARTFDWKRLGADYLSSTRPATAYKPRFIDKLPHNFLYAGFIARALPNARIICLRRDPMDTCLSNFRQLFEQTSTSFDYSYDLLDTGKYFVLFDHLMAHWQRVFPGRILELEYETLVDTQEASTRQLLEFCGLPWHDACLQFENNPAPVATFSATQVRTPLYRSAIRRWKKYEAELAELRMLLSDAGIKFSA